MTGSGRVPAGLAGVALLVAAACSGGDDTSEGTAAAQENGATTAPPTTATVGTDTAGTTPTPLSTEPASTATTSPTTTTEPPLVIPVGVRWDGPIAISGGVAQSQVERMQRLGDELWLTGSRWNASFVFRSTDGGVTWTEVVVEPPPESGTSRVGEMVRGPDGRYVAIGNRWSECIANDDVDGGFRNFGRCIRVRPVVHLSDDGVAWRQVEPDAMAPVPGGSMRLESIAATGDGYLATGTSRSTEWFTVIWSSPDGETWTRAREIRGVDGPISPTQLLTDGQTLVLLAEEHPCGIPTDHPVFDGWAPGQSSVPDHLRIFQGTTPESLALLTPAEHPLAPEPVDVDCSTLGGVSPLEFANAPYPGAVGAIVGGAITVLERFVSDDERAQLESDDVDRTTVGSRRIAQLVDGDWTLIEVDGVRTAADQGAALGLLDVDGSVGIHEIFDVPFDSARIAPTPILPRGGVLESVAPERPVYGDLAKPPITAGPVPTGPVATWVDGALVLATTNPPDPYTSIEDFFDPVEINVWRSVETTGEQVVRCDLVAGGSCVFGDVSTVEGYPDFNGIDLTGADLRFADLGAAEFAGANFAGARLWGATTDERSTFAGADFTAAGLQDAQLSDVSGASFAEALLADAQLGDASGATFTGASMRLTDIGFVTLPDFTGVELAGIDLQPLPVPGSAGREVSLAGLDLTGATVRGGDKDDLLTITDLTGTVLDSTNFILVDLTQIDPAIDLTEVDVWDDSICPDGLPPDGGFIGTCVRGLPDG